MFPIYTKMETKSAKSAEKVPNQNNKKKYIKLKKTVKEYSKDL